MMHLCLFLILKNKRSSLWNVEVVKPERIVIKHAVFPHFLATATFEDLDGKTKLTYSTVFEENEATFDKVKAYAVPGAEQTMDRLGEHLASMS